jgi:uncharacterized membrane protein (DUF106 family)
VTAPVMLGLLGTSTIIGVLVFTNWRLAVIDREQAQLYQDFMRLQSESEKAQRQLVKAIASRLQTIEAALIQIDNRTAAVTDWAQWWAATLAQTARQ